MKKMMLWMVAFVALAVSTLHAQDITGTWQGTLQAGKSLRLVLKIAKADDGSLKGKIYSIDQGGQLLPTGPITQQGTSVKFDVSMVGGGYEGKLSADGASMTGTWTQGGNPLPLNLAHVTDATAWEIPAIVPEKLMAADADPAFEVATIKPNDTGASGMQQLTMNHRNFKVRAGSLVNLIAFAYSVQAKQIVGAADWMDKDRYDIDAIPDQEGTPSPQQLRSMIRKLLADRFALKFHHDTRDLAAFVLTVSKSGQKLTPTQSTGPLPGLFFRPSPTGLGLNVTNATMGDLSEFLQSIVLDRPVVDKTALTGRFDFHLVFTPDESEFNGHPPKLPQVDESAAAPDLFDALQQQIGLKLSQDKTAVDVLVIDHVEKPSAN